MRKSFYLANTYSTILHEVSPFIKICSSYIIPMYFFTFHLFYWMHIDGYRKGQDVVSLFLEAVLAKKKS